MIHVSSLGSLARTAMLSIALLATPLSARPGAAQAPAKGTEYRCPVTLNLTYGKVERLPFDGREYDIAGFEARFAPAVARLIMVDLSPDPKMDRISSMADNAETAKPGQPLIYTVWPKEEKDPPGAQYVTCAYEGGLALYTLLPKETRTCTLRSASQPAPGTSTRNFYSSAVFTCQ